MTLALAPHQIKALPRMKNGCILCGGVGSGKSRTSLAYYFTKVVGGSLSINGQGEFKEPTKPVDLYILTTAQKRDRHEWEEEFMPFLLSTNSEDSICGIRVVIDSWNNIKKYVNVSDAMFIFDEDRVTGKGVWVKTFLKIVKRNQWILLSATPGDNWSDYVPVFIANGFYKNFTDFNNLHVVWNRYTTYPKVDKYVNTKRLYCCRDAILIPMEFERKTIPNDINVSCTYDISKYKTIMKYRWDPFEEKPIENISKLCYLLRKVTNSDLSRSLAVRQLTTEHPRTIIFYNFDYEREILLKLGEELNIETAEWNGHVHQKIPNTKRWMYLVQYAAGSEGWNCITTDTIIFYSQNYSYKTMVQASGRINRLNTPYTNLYFYHLKSSAPIDRAIAEALKTKKEFNERKFISWK